MIRIDARGLWRSIRIPCPQQLTWMGIPIVFDDRVGWLTVRGWGPGPVAELLSERRRCWPGVKPY